MICDAPTNPLIKSIDKMLGTFFLHQYIFATTVNGLFFLDSNYLHILIFQFFSTQLTLQFINYVLTDQVFCRRQIGECRSQKKYSQIDFEVRNRDFGKFSVVEWIGMFRTVQLVGFTTHDIIGRPPCIQKLVLPQSQSVTFAIVFRCFQNKPNNC